MLILQDGLTTWIAEIRFILRLLRSCSRRSKNNGIWLRPTIFLTELVALLSSRYHLPRQQVIAAINAIKMDAAVEIVYINQILDDEAWALLEARPDKEWSLVDASSFVIMKRFG
ncbi:MAG TPA: hypothetical protein VGL94_16780, partial [Ktedonobacteraceae bacterium]